MTTFVQSLARNASPEAGHDGGHEPEEACNDDKEDAKAEHDGRLIGQRKDNGSDRS